MEQRYTVSADGCPVPLIPAQVWEKKGQAEPIPHTMYLACIEHDFQTPLTLRVRHTDGGEAEVRPHALGLQPVRQGEEDVLTLTSPAKLSLEYGGNLYENLFVFALQPDAQRPDPAAPGVHYFGPGEHHPGEIRLSSGETLYLDAGATVYGRVCARDAEHITVAGHGILHGGEENHDTDRKYHMFFEDCRDVTVRDVLLCDSPAWSFVTMRCRGVTAEGLRQVSYNWNSDGFDICGSEDVTIDGAFIRNFDDNISLKSFGGHCRNITMKNSVLWCDCAHNMLVGPEADREQGTVFENILFENIDVLESREYCETYMGVMAIMCADRARIRNVCWRNIRVERLSHGKLVQIRYVTAYAKELGRSVEDIRFERITAELPERPVITIAGADAGRTVQRVTFDDLQADPVWDLAAFTGPVVCNGTAVSCG